MMKRVVCIFLAALLLTCCLALPAGAQEVSPLVGQFRRELDTLDIFYDYNEFYMMVKANDIACADAANYWDPVTLPAAEYEAILHRYFVIDDKTVEKIRTIDPIFIRYDAAAQTYTVQRMGGVGGALEERTYLGFVKNGETYDVFYQHRTLGYLADVLPNGVDEYMYAESLGYPEELMYDGRVYTSNMGNYYTVLSLDDYGRKYTVELNGDIVRIISCTEYTATDLPEKFDDLLPEETTAPPDTAETTAPTLPDDTTVPPDTAETTAPDTTDSTDASGETTLTPDTGTSAPDSNIPDSTAPTDDTNAPDGKPDLSFIGPAILMSAAVIICVTGALTAAARAKKK